MSLEVTQGPVFTPLHASRPEAASVAAGYSSGYTAGWSAGARAAAQDAEEQRRRAAEELAVRAQQAATAAQEALSVLARAAEAARHRAAPVLSEAQGALTRAAVDLAETVLGAELGDGDASARSALRRALSVRDEGLVRVRLNPEDLAHLTATLDSLPAELGLPAGVELVADPALGRGDAVSELEEGYLDARVGAAVSRVRDALEVTE
ncbi:flagellar assembly protein FliH [Georgenia satyanarayanai]|uniref:Flagellar assembly protein FliH n=1 Tax=Georgenia satyanarayanai TaxID=860221 RepID=A0A2Y9A480_9MICO|nr:FliH/SctL family protein [Georgenia satyanarayanai]PYG01072.1 flagellar assembly protein FliH [Georgenia satyanarayanai]SSA39311.1 flagellar assembly protein FliH [Georgenia satyanarayanai]